MRSGCTEPAAVRNRVGADLAKLRDAVGHKGKQQDGQEAKKGSEKFHRETTIYLIRVLTVACE